MKVRKRVKESQEGLVSISDAVVNIFSNVTFLLSRTVVRNGSLSYARLG